jgi:hypothetical protein
MHLPSFIQTVNRLSGRAPQQASYSPANPTSFDWVNHLGEAEKGGDRYS